MKSPQFKRSNPALVEVTGKIASYIEETGVVDAINYSSLLHSLGKLRAQDVASQRIVNHLKRPESAKAFLDTGTPLATSKVVWSLSKLQRFDLLKRLKSQVSEAYLESLFDVGGVAIVCPYGSGVCVGQRAMARFVWGH
jgi:hypothetical protein